MMVCWARRRSSGILLERAPQACKTRRCCFKYLGRPVVVAPYGITVGGGVEIAMHSARMVAPPRRTWAWWRWASA